MLIDLILDRRAGDRYSAKEMYDYCNEEYIALGWYKDVVYAMDYGTEKDVKKALCDYIMGEYNPEICDYVNSVNWLEDDK